MAITVNSDRDFDVQILTEAIRGAFSGRNCFMGSPLVSGGAVMVNSSMPTPSPGEIGNEITVPYFGTLGEFVNNPDGSSVTPGTLKTTNERSQIARSSLAFEVSRWAQNPGREDLDPYEEAVRQIQIAAVRRHDKVMVTEAMTTPHVYDVYSATTPVTLSYDVMVDARSMWGDENQDIVGAVTHSRTMADLRKVRDADGRTLLVESMKADQLSSFAGCNLFESDLTPLTGSTMGTVVSSGTGTEPVMTITGEPLGAWKLRVRVSGSTLTLGTALIQFSTDKGQTWSAPIATAAAGVPKALIDTASDSLVGRNGATGLSVAFAGDFQNADNLYWSTANLKVRTLILKRGALAYYYASSHMGLETDKNILAHTDIAAMHIYHVAHLYRRVATGGTMGGCIAIAHNVSGFAGDPLVSAP